MPSGQWERSLSQPAWVLLPVPEGTLIVAGFIDAGLVDMDELTFPTNTLLSITLGRNRFNEEICFCGEVAMGVMPSNPDAISIFSALLFEKSYIKFFICLDFPCITVHFSFGFSVG